MATLTQVTLTCDVCGGEKDVQTRTFGLDGKTYQIDLCPKDGDGLSKVAAGYASQARKATARQGSRHGGRKPRVRAETAASRAGAGAPGKKTSGRGRGAGSSRQAAKNNSTQQAAKTDASRQAAKNSRPRRQAAKNNGAKAESAGAMAETKAGRPGRPNANAASELAAKAASVQPEKGIYVYGILPADIEVAGDIPGVGEDPGPLRVVRRDGLAALISEVDPSGQLGAPDDLRTHREILDLTAVEVPVLPLRFGTVLASEDAVAEELLAASHDQFADALDRLEGHVEFLVKGRYIDDTVTADREDDTRALEKAMEEHCVASVVRPPTGELDAVRVAFLVAADEEGEIERVVEDLAQEWDGRIEVQLIGPMAAYDFAGTGGIQIHKDGSAP